MLINSPNISGSLTVTGNSVISGSLTVLGSITGAITGSATSASYVEYTNVANKPTLVSGSGQISFNGITDKPTLVSGSSQVSFNGITDKPTLVSGSSQITYSGLTGIPVGIVSGSAQVTALGFASTGSSNTFQASQTITGSLFITQNLVVAGSSSIQYISSSVLDIADNIITVNAFNPGVRFGGLAVIDSGSSPQVSGSMLFDSIKDQWIFVHQNQSVVTSSVVLMGPETYNDLGNEAYISANRLPKGSGVEHLRDSNITDTGTVVSVNSNTAVTGSFTVTTGSVVELQVTNLGVNIGNSTADNHNVTGSLRVSGSLAVTGAGTFNSSVTATSLTAGTSAGSSVNITTNSNNGTSGSPLQTNVNFYGFNGNLNGQIRVDDIAGTSQIGTMKFYTWNSGQVLSLTLTQTGAGTFSSSVTAGAFLTNGANGTAGQEAIRINNDNGYIGFFNSANSTRSGYIQGNTTDLTIATSPSNPLIFATANTERMRINSAGDIQYKGSSTTANAQAYIENTNADLIFYASLSGSVSKNMRFFYNGGTGEGMRLTSGGNVLIGTTTDSGYKLDVQQGATNAAKFNFAVTGAWGGGSNQDHGMLISGARYTSDTNTSLLHIINTDNTSLFRVTDYGKVGIGTFTPSTNLHVEGPTVSYGQVRILSTSNSVGEASIHFGRTNQTLEQRWTVGQGVASIGDSFGFYTGGSPRMVLTTGGQVLFGTTSGTGITTGTSANQGVGIGGGVLEIQTNNNSNIYLSKATGYTSGDFTAHFVNGSYVGGISTNGSATNYATASDYRLKQDLKDFDGITLINKIKTYDYEWKVDNTRMFGVIAHELQEILPFAVTGEKDAERMQGVDYSKLIPVLVKAIQELKAENDTLKSRIDTLEQA